MLPLSLADHRDDGGGHPGHELLSSALLDLGRIASSERPSDFATLPEAIEIKYELEAHRVPWIQGLAAGSDGTLYYAENEAVRRVDPDGIVSLLAEDIEIPGLFTAPITAAARYFGGSTWRPMEPSTSRHLHVAPWCESRLTGRRTCPSDPRTPGRRSASLGSEIMSTCSNSGLRTRRVLSGGPESEDCLSMEA